MKKYWPLIIVYLVIAGAIYFLLYKWYKYSQCKKAQPKADAFGMPLIYPCQCNFWKDCKTT